MNITQTRLNNWFGPGKAFSEKDLVKNYMNQLLDSNLVSMKFIIFSNPSERLGIISDRGQGEFPSPEIVFCKNMINIKPTKEC